MKTKLILNKLLVILLSIILIAASDCKGFAEHYLTILHTNDVHGRLEPFRYKNTDNLQGGIAKRAALIKDIKSNTKYVLTVDSGDIAQGTLFFKYFNGIPDMKFMSDIGYDAAAPGNHEFDKSLDVFAQMTNTASFPFVCANLDFKEQENIKLNKYIIKDFGEFKVGIIGVIAENLKAITMIRDDVKVKNPVKETRKIVSELKNKVDLIVILSHQGVDNDIILAKEVPEIDVIVGGHSHTYLNKPIMIKQGTKKTIIVQTGELGINLGRADIKFSKNNLDNYEYKLIPIGENVKEDETVSKQVEILSSQVQAQTNEVIGTTLLPINNKSSGLSNIAGVLVNNAVKESFPDADVIFQNSGAIRLKHLIQSGNITKADVFEIFPFENKPVSGELKGIDIKHILENSSASLPVVNDFFLQSKGIEYTVDLSQKPQKMSPDGTKILEKGNRVRDIVINGYPIDYDKYYKVAANDFLFKGGDGFIQFKKARNIKYSDIFIQDLIVKYIKNTSPLNLRIQDKIKVINGNNNCGKDKVLPITNLLYDNMFAKPKFKLSIK